MKNKFHEKMRLNAIQYAKKGKSSRFPVLNGATIYHVYGEENNDKKMSYWDDTAFRYGKQIYFVAWEHPRFLYSEEAHSKAFELIDYFAKPNFDFDRKAIYKKVGKSRKKIAFYEMLFDEDRHNYYERLNEKIKEILENGDIEAKPYFKVEQGKYGKSVYCCFPMEVLKEEDVVELKNKVIEFIKNPLLFKEMYQDFVYTKEDWLAENCEDRIENAIHGVNVTTKK